MSETLESRARAEYKSPFWEGQVVTDNKGGPYVVEKVNNAMGYCAGWSDTMVTIKFLETSSVRLVSAQTIRGYNVKDLHRPTIATVGFIGDGPYRARRSLEGKHKKFRSYALWENMLWRVYDDKHRLSNRYRGRQAVVCDEWHNFQNFCAWYLENKPPEGNYALDSDLLSSKVGRKIYSPETCVFIPQELNKFFCAMNKNRGKYPVGVRKIKHGYESRVVHNGETFISYADTPEQAFLIYKHKKEELLQQMVDEMLSQGRICKRAYDACIEWEAVPFPD